MQSKKTKRPVPGSDDGDGKRGHEGQDLRTGDDTQDDKGPIPCKRATGEHGTMALFINWRSLNT